MDSFIIHNTTEVDKETGYRTLFPWNDNYEKPLKQSASIISQIHDTFYSIRVLKSRQLPVGKYYQKWNANRKMIFGMSKTILHVNFMCRFCISMMYGPPWRNWHDLKRGIITERSVTGVDVSKSIVIF